MYRSWQQQQQLKRFPPIEPETTQLWIDNSFIIIINITSR